MIATGTDVKPLECLLFMRDVEPQLLRADERPRHPHAGHGRLQKVTPSAKTAKTHYVIVDAIGVTKSLKTASQPLITKPGVPLKDLAMGILMGATDTDSVSSLAGRLARLNKQLDADDQRRLPEAAGGVELSHLVSKLFNAIDGDLIEARALELELAAHRQRPRRHPARPGPATTGRRSGGAAERRIHRTDRHHPPRKEQTIDHDNLDHRHLRWLEQGQRRAEAEALTGEFADWLDPPIRTKSKR